MYVHMVVKPVRKWPIAGWRPFLEGGHGRYDVSAILNYNVITILIFLKKKKHNRSGFIRITHSCHKKRMWIKKIISTRVRTCGYWIDNPLVWIPDQFVASYTRDCVRVFVFLMNRTYVDERYRISFYVHPTMCM